MARRRKIAPNTAVGYIRCSTEEQADSGLGLEAQRSAIVAECARKGWQLVEVFEDAGYSGRSVDGRPGLAAALDTVASGGAAALVVAKLDRLSRSVRDAAQVLEQAQRRGWALVVLDVNVDTSTPAGELVVNVMASTAQWERRIIGARTREALAAKRAQGVRLGRPRSLPDAVVRRVVAAHDAGAGWSAIARDLNAEGVATAHGGVVWYPSTVQAVYRSAASAA